MHEEGLKHASEGYLIVVNGQNIKNIGFGTSHFWAAKGGKLLRSLRAHQVPLNSLQTAISQVLGGPWPWLYGPGSHYVGPHGCSSTRIVTK